MGQMLPFVFVEFYDVPRCIVLRHQEKVLLLQSAFDEKVDEYEGKYSVYLMPDSIEEMAKAGAWSFMASAQRVFVGEVAIKDVIFDPTRHKEIDAACLDGFV